MAAGADFSVPREMSPSSASARNARVAAEQRRKVSQQRDVGRERGGREGDADERQRERHDEDGRAAQDLRGLHKLGLLGRELTDHVEAAGAAQDEEQGGEDHGGGHEDDQTASHRRREQRCDGDGEASSAATTAR